MATKYDKQHSYIHEIQSYVQHFYKNESSTILTELQLHAPATELFYVTNCISHKNTLSQRHSICWKSPEYERWI